MNEIRSLAQMKTVGEMLRVAREKKNLSLSDVHKFTKIHPKFLQALEEGDYAPFSSEVHIKGFLKLYASLLGLNVEEVLAFFRREFDAKKEKRPRVLRPIESQKFVVTPANVTIFATVFLVLVFFSYLFYQYRSYTGNPSLVIEKPLADVVYTQTALEVVGKTDRDSNVFLNGQEIDINPDGTFVTRIDLSEGLNSLNFLAINQLGKETSILRTVLVKKDEFVMGVLGAMGVKDIKVEVLADGGSSTLSVEVDGSNSFEGTILQGTTSVFEASASVRLKAGNAGAISIKLNGEDLGPFGAEGEQKEQEFK